MRPPSSSLCRDFVSASKRSFVAGMVFAEGNSRGSAAVESEAESSRNGFLGEETMDGWSGWLWRTRRLGALGAMGGLENN